ncbi:MAG: DUF4136 domain-containing protein [Bacteroidetes bacterium]|nr:DUF4136 domain-containing protein [Bacteroidota bacterium]
MKTRKNLSIAIIVLLSILTGCGIYTEISVSSDASLDFSKYKTFAWLPDDIDTATSPYNNEIIRNNLKNYFGRNFSERGFSVNLDTPDVLLQIVIENKKKEAVYPIYPRTNYYCSYYYCSSYYSPYPYNYYYHHYNNFYCDNKGECTKKTTYVEGSITLNVIDRKQHKIIWSGTAKGDIYDDAYINRDIHPAVLRIMKKFPVKSIERKTTSKPDVVFNH